MSLIKDPVVQTGDWKRRLDVIVSTMRDISLHTDPQEMVRTYASRMREILPVDASMSLSRRDLPPPNYRITRSTLWTEIINPWKERNRLPILQGGMLGELIYGDQPRVIDDLEVAPNDPARKYFEGMRSMIALPNFENGEALNMVLLMRKQRAAFRREELPELVWMSNLFGRATSTLVISSELRNAYHMLDEELKTVADIQRSLLPATLPRVPNLDIAAYYHTSQRAGGDYYDFFQLRDGKLGMLIADVSGHGTPAAVVMAITHAIAHMLPDPKCCPGVMLTEINRHLTERYTASGSDFVTAFYGVYDPPSRSFTYACAGHNPPRLKSCTTGTMSSLDAVSDIPLGIFDNIQYKTATRNFRPGDQIVFYTDGITEASAPDGSLFGADRLDHVLENCHLTASGLIESVLDAVGQFTQDKPATDDRTILVARVL